MFLSAWWTRKGILRKGSLCESQSASWRPLVIHIYIRVIYVRFKLFPDSPKADMILFAVKYSFMKRCLHRWPSSPLSPLIPFPL